MPISADADLPGPVEQHIPVLVTPRGDTAAAAEPGGARDRCLIQPERLSRRQTEAGGAASAASSASVDNGSGLKVELLNVQSLLPKLPDIWADLQSTETGCGMFHRNKPQSLYTRVPIKNESDFLNGP